MRLNCFNQVNSNGITWSKTRVQINSKKSTDLKNIQKQMIPARNNRAVNIKMVYKLG